MSEKMRVLQLGPYPPPRGGVQTNMLAIRDELLKNGHECSIVSITKSEKIAPEKNVFHPRNFAELLRLLFSLKYDILHLHIGGGLPFRVFGMILTCALTAKGKSLMTFHSGGYAAETIEKASYGTFQGFVFRQLSKIIVVNELMIEMFKTFGVKAENIKLIRPFVLNKPDENVELPQKCRDFYENHKKVLITVGLLEIDYDLPLQINVLERVLRKFPDAGLIIVGSGSLEKDLRELIASKPYAEKVLLAGDTDRQIVLHLIEKSDLMLRTTVFDGDAISVREAIYLGTPVIATDNGMRPEGVRLIPKQNIDALEEAIEEQLKIENKLEKSGADGWENIRAVVEVYKEMTCVKKLKGEEVKVPSGSYVNPKSKI